jgi:hypothetical protein
MDFPSSSASDSIPKSPVRESPGLSHQPSNLPSVPKRLAGGPSQTFGYYKGRVAVARARIASADIAIGDRSANRSARHARLLSGPAWVEPRNATTQLMWMIMDTGTVKFFNQDKGFAFYHAGQR